MPTISNFFQDAYPATDELQCITVYIPAGDEFKWLLAGLLRLPSLATSYQDPESEQAQGLADVWRDGYDLTDWEGCVNPVNVGALSRTTLWHRWATVTTGNPIQVLTTTAQEFNVVARQNPPGANDDSYQDVWLPEGEYSMRVLYIRGTSNGILTVVFQHQPDLTTVVPINMVDLYGVAANNQILTATFTLTQPGHYKVYFVTQGKNPSSSNYYIQITCTEIWKTADL